MDNQMKARLTSSDAWMRALYMIFFVIVFSVAEIIITLLVVFQFLSVLITGGVNEPLLRFGRNLGEYVFQILQFETFNSEVKPYPFSEWPDEAPGGEDWLEEQIEDPLEEQVEEQFDVQGQVLEPETGTDTAQHESDSDTVDDADVSASRKDANPPSA